MVHATASPCSQYPTVTAATAMYQSSFLSPARHSHNAQALTAAVHALSDTHGKCHGQCLREGRWDMRVSSKCDSSSKVTMRSLRNILATVQGDMELVACRSVTMKTHPCREGPHTKSPSSATMATPTFHHCCERRATLLWETFCDSTGFTYFCIGDDAAGTQAALNHHLNCNHGHDLRHHADEVKVAAHLVRQWRRRCWRAGRPPPPSQRRCHRGTPPSPHPHRPCPAAQDRVPTLVQQEVSSNVVGNVLAAGGRLERFGVNPAVCRRCVLRCCMYCAVAAAPA